ncbi:MAG: cytochrome ubiquinol oxidase subunit I [Coriobacteriales bacterium]|jgi:cytochrome d ubiquinol oxidase subunit I|nr:cytochrome ubiquinol oxidase subunit I [Coriobacteriales bacterium]
MEFLDVTALARLQFAITVIFHFLFVPLSIGLGLFVALAETRYYRTKDPKDRAATKFWAKIFTTTFVIGVATGITMEFSFGTNWANYARFVGDIFGAPLAAEALLAFFLESIFLGVVLFAREKIAPKLYLVSTWLVFIGSALSALWILIANSWMQTPAGYEVLPDGSKAVITDFWAAALNPSTVARYLHTVDALLILGSFCVIAIGAWYLVKKRNEEYGRSFIKTGLIVGIITVVLMLPFAHMQATVVAEQQPAKLAAMEAQWEDGPAPYTFFAWIDSDTQTRSGFEIAGFTSFLATFDSQTVYPGLNTLSQPVTDFSAYPGVKVDSYQGGTPPVGLTFQSYHLMVTLYAALILWLIFAGVALKKAKNGKFSKPLLYLLVFGPIVPFLSIQAGWMVAEVGRQPWVVYDLLLTDDAVSPVVTSVELLITIVLFVVFYAVLFIAWLRIIFRHIKEGPIVENAVAGGAAANVKETEAGDAATKASADSKGGGQDA